MAKGKLSAEALEFFRKAGKKGGKKSGAARMEKLTAEQRSELASKAATARWTQKQDESLKVHGDPLDTPKKPPKKKGK
jgi:hypothetical protein